MLSVHGMLQKSQKEKYVAKYSDMTDVFNGPTNKDETKQYNVIARDKKADCSKEKSDYVSKRDKNCF